MNTVFAHEHEGRDGSIQATMHIDPLDHPVVGQEARFFFSFTDSADKFKIDQCNCQVTLERGGVEIETKIVTATTGPLYAKTFAQAGDYELHLHGGPKNGATFEAFDLHFNVPVAQAQSHTATQGMAPDPYSAHPAGPLGAHWLHLVIFGGGFVAAIIFLIRGFYQKKKQ